MADATLKKVDAPLAIPRGWARPLAEINATIRKAEDGNQSAMAEIREMLVPPGHADLLGGNIAKKALQQLVKVSCGGNAVIQASTERKFDEMRSELLGPSPTALERLLVERVIATWFHLHNLELHYASKESMTLDLGQYYQKCITSAQKRYLAAIKGLAEVRKLALPALQVNIAKKQVNVATGTAA